MYLIGMKRVPGRHSKRVSKETNGMELELLEPI
jgi:hypothetical protein